MSIKREQIVDAAMRAAKQDGLRSVSFRQLAEEVGVKSASVHYHFPAKTDLAESMVRSYTEQFEAQLTQVAQGKRTLLGKLDALIQIFDDVLEGNDLCLCGMMAAELTALDVNTHRALKHFFKVTEHWLTREIEAHRDDIGIDLAPEELGKVILASLEGAILLDRVDGGRTRLEAFKRFVRAILN